VGAISAHDPDLAAAGRRLMDVGDALPARRPLRAIVLSDIRSLGQASATRLNRVNLIRLDERTPAVPSRLGGLCRHRKQPQDHGESNCSNNQDDSTHDGPHPVKGRNDARPSVGSRPKPRRAVPKTRLTEAIVAVCVSGSVTPPPGTLAVAGSPGDRQSPQNSSGEGGECRLENEAGVAPSGGAGDAGEVATDGKRRHGVRAESRLRETDCPHTVGSVGSGVPAGGCAAGGLE
jgi:hypothetical protein